MIGRFPPAAVARQLHCAEAESVNGNVPTDYESAAPSGGPRIGSVGMLSRGTFSGRAHNIYTRSFSVSMVSSAKKFFGFDRGKIVTQVRTCNSVAARLQMQPGEIVVFIDRNIVERLIYQSQAARVSHS